jgi:HD-like signal output (HDOD) protein
MALLDLVRKREVPMADMVALCEQDAMVAPRVIRVAESASSRTAVPVRSPEDAAVRLGLRTPAGIFFWR